MESLESTLAIAVPLAGALGYVGKMLITAFMRNIDRQQDLAERHLTLLVEGVAKQSTALTELILQNKAHQERSVRFHTEQCSTLQALLHRTAGEQK